MTLKAFVLTGLILVCSFAAARAQAPDNPGDYMSRVSAAQTEMDQKYMAYVSAAAHSHRAKKIDRLRTQALESINDAKYKTSDLPQYQGDNSLRQAGIDYIQFCYRIFNDDYSKIVDMEEISEQSVDAMEAYLMLQEKTAEKLREATAHFSQAEKDFADKYHVTLVDTKGPLHDKMQTAGLLNRYCDRVYILFFKGNYEENELFSALNEQKLNDAEQARVAMLKYSEEGIAALKSDSLASFDGNPRLADGCREILRFYRQMAVADIPRLMDFYLKSGNFDKMKKALDARGDNRTKEEIAAFNKAAKDMNAQINAYNQQNIALNKQRQEASLNWQAADRDFRDKEMPYYKK